MTALPDARFPAFDGTPLLPAGRVGYDLAAPVLLCHSFVSAEAWETLSRTGRLTAPGRVVETAPDFRAAYRWLARRMEERVGPRPGPDVWPLWVWCRTSRRHLLESAARMADHYPGTVLVTLRIPRGQVLLSAFDQWHCVLNGTRLPGPDWWHSEGEPTPAETAAEDAYARLLVEHHPGRRPGPGGWEEWPAPLRAALESSWEPVLDPTAWRRSDTDWQGTTWEFRADHVVDAAVVGGARLWEDVLARDASWREIVDERETEGATVPSRRPAAPVRSPASRTMTV